MPKPARISMIHSSNDPLVVHPAHYGGDTVYETIKVIRAWGLGFNLGNTVKYLSRAGKKGRRLQDLEKALFYLQDEIRYERELLVLQSIAEGPPSA